MSNDLSCVITAVTEFYDCARGSLQSRRCWKKKTNKISKVGDTTTARFEMQSQSGDLVDMESQSGDFTGNTLNKVHGCS